MALLYFRQFLAALRREGPGATIRRSREHFARLLVSHGNLPERVEALEALTDRQAETITNLLESMAAAPARPSEGSGSGRAKSAAAKISIILPVWNRARLLPRAIESVLAQSLQAWELIVVDDGSTDGSERAAGPYLSDTRVHLFRREHRGVSAARNYGLEHSTAPLIGYLDSDCKLYPRVLDEVVAAMTAAPEADCLYCGQHWVDRESGEASILADVFSRQALLGMRTRLDLNVFFHRRALYEKYGGFDPDLRRLVDWDLILRYTAERPPLRIPYIGSYYEAGVEPRISNTEPLEENRIKVLTKHTGSGRRPPRVLYALNLYPQLSETYISREIEFMQRQGVDVITWSAELPQVPYPVDHPVLRGPLERAIRRTRPDLVHAHWLHHGRNILPAVAAAGLQLTIRGHGFAFDAGLVTTLAKSPGLARMYLFGHLITPGIASERVRAVSAAVGLEQFESKQKDARMVLRLCTGLPKKEIRLFLRAAQDLPEFRFLLGIVRANGVPEYIEEILAFNEQLPRPVEILVNVPHERARELTREAGIYLHTCGRGEVFGMPISMIESLAAGSYVLARRRPEADSYLGGAGRLYGDREEAVSQIRETLEWDDARWEKQREASVARARLFSEEIIFAPILEDWRRLAAEETLLD